VRLRISNEEEVENNGENIKPRVLQIHIDMGILLEEILVIYS